MSDRWVIALKGIKQAAEQFWSKQQTTYFMVTDNRVWSRMSNFAPRLAAIPGAPPLTEAEDFLVRVVPYLYQIGWQESSHVVQSFQTGYEASARLIHRSYNRDPQVYDFGLRSLDSATIEMLLGICRSMMADDLTGLPLAPTPAGFDQTARLRYVAALCQLNDILEIQRGRNVPEHFPLPDDPSDLQRIMRFMLHDALALLEFKERHLMPHIRLHPEDEPLKAAVANVLEEPIKRWMVANAAWLEAECQYKLYLKPSQITLSESGLAHPRIPPMAVDYLTSFSPTPFQYVDGPDAISIHDSPEYEDFNLIVTPGGDYTATTSFGHVVCKSVLAPRLDAVNEFRLSLLNAYEQVDEDTLIRFGHVLYEMLFPRDVQNLFIRSEERAIGQNKRIRLRLIIESQELVAIPWELVHHPERGYFMAVNPDTLVTRSVSQSIPRAPRQKIDHWNVLVLISSPQDQPKLDVTAWKSEFDQAFPATQFSLKYCRPTRTHIPEVVAHYDPHLVFFVGHGRFEDHTGSLALIHPDSDQNDLLDDRDFANLFLGHIDSIQLISLIACESAKSDSLESFRGVAQQLVQRGIGAVVAMQYPIRVSSAKHFLRGFCGDLVKDKQIDKAVQAARQQMKNAIGPSRRDFATPVLYLAPSAEHI